MDRKEKIAAAIARKGAAPFRPARASTFSLEEETVRRRISSLLLLLAGSLVLGVLAPATLFGAPGNHTKDVIVLDFDIVVPAAEGCSGEDVHVFGTLDLIIQTTSDSRGGLHVVFHLTPHLTGVGLSTGLEYNAVGPTQTVDFVDGTGPRVSALINVIQLVSPGSSDNLVVTETLHVTVNANGTTTVEFDNVNASCRG
jgi:hypothetical protein